MSRIPIPPTLRDQSVYKNKKDTESVKEFMPIIKSDKLRCPKDLTDGAKKEWRRVVKIYGELEIPLLNELDVELLRSYCQAVDIRASLYKAYCDDPQLLVPDYINLQGITADGENNIKNKKTSKSAKQIINPILDELRRYEQRITILGEQLCLTPIGRTRLAIGKEKKSRAEAEGFYDD